MTAGTAAATEPSSRSLVTWSQHRRIEASPPAVPGERAGSIVAWQSPIQAQVAAKGAAIGVQGPRADWESPVDGGGAK